MKSKSLTTDLLKETDILRELRRLLNHTLEVEGQILWAKLFQEKTANGKPSDEIIVTFEQAQTAIQDLVINLGRKGLKGKVELAFELGVQSTTLFSSLFLGLILPQNNLILFKRDQKQDAITIERASLFVSELFLDWMGTILNRTLETSHSIHNVSLKLEIQKHLQFSQKLTQNAKAGLTRGSTLRNRTSKLFARLQKRTSKDIRIPMEERAFIALESFLNQTLRSK